MRNIKTITMQLDTSTATAAVRNHFGVSDMAKASVTYSHKGQITSIYMADITTKKGMPYFDHLRCLAMAAKQELDMKKEAETC